MGMRHDRLAEGELRLRAAIGGEAGLVRLDLAEPHRAADAGIADRAGDPAMVARARAAALRRPALGREFDRGQPAVDRKGVVYGQAESVRAAQGGRRIIIKKTDKHIFITTS